MPVLKTTSVLAFTQDMMLAVIEERWNVLMDMQFKQEQMLQAIFADHDLAFTDVEKDDLVEVQRLNQEVLIAAEAHKSDIAKELRAMRLGKTKANIYQAL